MAKINLGRVVGKDNYELAVQQGYVGTLDEWLESLKGKDGAPGTTDYNELDNKPDLSVYQTKTDDTLNTTSKQIVDSINEVNAKLPIDPTNGSETKYLNEKGKFSEIAIGGGGGVNVYLSNENSDISGYKQASPVIDATPTNKNVTAIAANVVAYNADKYLYPAWVATTLIPSGRWTVHLYGFLSAAAGVTKPAIRVFKYSTLGVETTLFEVQGFEVNNTTNGEIVINTEQPSFAVLDTDRIGVQIGIITDSISPAKILTYTTGDGFASHFMTPLQLRHGDTRDKNGDPNFQHITSGEKENLVLKPFATDETVIAGTNETAPVNSRGALAGFMNWVGSKTFAALPTSAKTLLDSITELWTNKVDDLGGTIYHSTPWFTPVAGQSVTISADGLTVTLSSGALFTNAMVGARIVINGIRRVVGSYTSTSVIGVSSAFPASMRGATYTYDKWGVFSPFFSFNGGIFLATNYNNASIFGINYGRFYSGTFADSNYTFKLLWNEFKFGQPFFIKAGTTSPDSVADVGFKRNGAGTWEINDGNTAGVYRDLNLRNLNYTGSLTNTSDERLKKNIRPVTDGLKKVIDISKTIRHYEFIDQDAYGSGVITSEIAQYLLELGFNGHVKQRLPRNESEGKLFGWEYAQKEIVDKEGNPVLDQEGNKTFETVVTKEGDLIYTVDSQALTIYLFPAIVELNDKITAIEERLNKAGL